MRLMLIPYHDKAAYMILCIWPQIAPNFNSQQQKYKYNMILPTLPSHVICFNITFLNLMDKSLRKRFNFYYKFYYDDNSYLNSF